METHGGTRLTRDRVLQWVDKNDDATEDDPIWEDALVSMQGSEDARAYVKSCLDACSLSQFESLVRLYCGKPKTTRGGGKPTQPEEALDTDLEQLLDGLDTFHDFPEYAHDALTLRVPKHFPKDWEEWTVIQYLARTQTLVFPKAKRGWRHVVNPTFGCALWKSFEYPNDEADIHALFHRHECSLRHRFALANRERLLAVDIPIYKWGRRLDQKLLRFKAIVLACRAVREWLGPSCAFLMDGADPVVSRFVTGVFQVNDAFVEGVTLDKKWKDVQKAVREELEGDSQPVTEWKRVVADANVFDPPPLASDVNFDTRPTGRVNANVALLGGTAQEVRVELAGKQRILTKSRCMAYSSTGAAMQALEAYERNAPTSMNYTVHQWMDFKRAGDRGQVLHAKRYDQVVVTKDRFMALYAYAMGVRFILVRRKRPLIKEHPYHEAYTLVLGAPRVGSSCNA